MTEAVNVDTIIVKLIKAINIDDSKEIFNQCNAILRRLPDNNEALKGKAICLIRENKFPEALKIIDSISEDMILERSYCLYQMKNYDEVIDILKNRTDKYSQLLLAQVYYKQEKYDESLAIYEQFQNDEDYEIITNICAVYTVSDQAKKGFELFQKYLNNNNSYEVLYNIGCAYISLGDIEKADLYFHRSLSLVNQMLSEGGIENEEIYEIMAPINIQLAYILCLKGDKEGSITMLSDVVNNFKFINSDIVKSICLNNLIIMKYNKDFFDAYKKMKSLTEDIVNRMTSNQRKIIYVNKALLLLAMGKKTEFFTLVDSISAEDTIMGYILKVSECLQRKKIDEGITLLKDVEENKDIQLILIQFYINQGMYKEAIETLMKRKDILYKPAIQCLCIYICKHINDQTITSKVIEASLACAPNEQAQTIVYELNATFLLNQKQYKEAMIGYQKLLSQTDLSTPVRLRLIASCALAASHVDVSVANQMIKQLPSVSEEYGSMDLSLEDMETIISQRNFIKPRKVSIEVIEKNEDVKMEKKCKKHNLKRKQKKLEKYLSTLKENGKYKDPSELDTERWLPLKERTLMRKKRRNNQQQQVTGIGSQGTGAVSDKEANLYDAKARADEAKLNPKANTQSVGKVLKAKPKLNRKKKIRK